MKKFLAALFSVLVCGAVAVFAACNSDGNKKKPEKLKDGTALTLTEGGSQSIDLSEYISIEGTDYVYSANSSAESVATVSVSGNTATVTAVSKGSATVTASADEVSVTFAVTVNEKSQLPEEKPAPVFGDVTAEYDLKDESSKVLTLAPTSGSDTFSYTYALKEQDANVTISDAQLTVAYGEAVQKQLTIVASYTDGENPSAGTKTVEFKLNIIVTDTRAQTDPDAKYKVKNGNFSNGTEGWTMEGEPGAISEQSTFWAEEFPIFNVGKYFAGNEPETGKLKSSLFEVGGANKITFMLGAAGNKDCYITLEKADGTVLEIWRNAKFNDIKTGWLKDEIGKTQFACNLVTYVADLKDYAGQSVRVVLNDGATSDFGFINFDELVTYYAAADDVPAGAIPAVNELANKTELKTILDNALTAQGDYTAESYNAYAEKVAKAQAVYDKLSSTQAEVDEAKTAVENAFAALVLRVPEEKSGADKSFSLLLSKSRQITISEYVDENNLTLTYSAEAADGKVTVSEITEGKFTITANGEGETTVNIIVKHNGKTVLTVTLSVTVTSETAPVLKQTAVLNEVDLYSKTNKTDITLDFANNVQNVGELDLTYTVTLDNSPLTLTDTSYTYVYGDNYSETAEVVVFNVKIAYNANGTDGELEYAYTLKITDTSAYRIENGTFDSGLDRWTLGNPALGDVNNDEYYWVGDNESADGYKFGNEGNFFNAYAKNVEGAMGTLTSSPFKLGGSGRITYLLGGAKNADKVYLDIIEKDTGAILARYSNKLWQERTDNVKSGCKLIAYKADLSQHVGKTVYICVSDYGENDYGLFFLDSVETYYATADEIAQEFNEAEGVAHPDNIRTGGAVSKYQVYNGGFENGLEGWSCVEGALPGMVTDASTYFDGTSYEKVGTYVFTAVEGRDADVHNPGLEYRKGTIRSEKFTLKANAWISFKLGGSNYDTLGIRIVKTDGTVIARFQNTNVSSAGVGQLVQYKYHFNNAEEFECYIEIFDNEPNGEGERPWRLVVVDAIDTDLEAEPAGGNLATNQIA